MHKATSTSYPALYRDFGPRLGYKGVRAMTLKYEVTFFGESVRALTRSNLAMGRVTDRGDK